jgi:putative DNA methylase
MIDRWFPCDVVDRAVGTSEGSGRSEKAILTWFASRPVAQARAAVLTALLDDDPALQPVVEAAILEGRRVVIDELVEAIRKRYEDRPPVVLDVFSGRGMIPLEAARFGATAVGLDLSPVATLGGRLLAD